MTKIKVKLDFIKYSTPPKVDFAKNTVTKMTGNPTYPSPDVPLLNISANAADLETKYNLAQGGGPAQTAAMHAAELVLDDSMRKQAAYVQRIANGDEVKIYSSGFLPTKAQKDPIPAPLKPENLKLKSGEQPGSIIKINDTVKATKVYATIITYGVIPPITSDGNMIVINLGDSKIIIDISTERKQIYNNLPSGTRVNVKTAAFNAAGKSPDSDTINILVP